MLRLRNLQTASSILRQAMSSLKFDLRNTEQHFGPRLGAVTFEREDGSVLLEIRTPGLIAATSRGVVPHLSREHTSLTEAVRWVELPFESL